MATIVDFHRNRSVDVDPDWYAGQPETADVDAFPAAADEPVSHVPSVLQKLLKWGNYDGYGEPVWPSRFIPMKTPLSEEILDSWELPEPPKHRLTVPDLLAAQIAAGRHVGLLLDLSNHDCLYAGDIPSYVQYLHVQLVAKELPPLEFVHEVGRAANQFWEHHEDQYIAIHCAYGFNRTGFVVCSYLIEHCGLSVEQALASFAKSRPPGVKHERFRDELHARYGSINHQLPRPITCIHAAAVYAQCNCSSASLAGCIQQGALLPPFLQPHLIRAATAGAGADVQYSSCSQCSSGTRVQGVCCGDCSCGQCQQQNAAAGALANSSSGSSLKALPPVPTPPGAAASATTEGCYQLGAKAMQRSGSTSSSTRVNFGVSVLSSSPLPRMPQRCQSSCSVGDNSSIGCSPPDSGADLLLLAGSNYSPASSSALGSVQGFRVPVGLMGCSPGHQQQQQRLQQAADGRSMQLDTSVRGADAPHGSCSDAEGAANGARIAHLEDADADCFDMDPCGEQRESGVTSRWCEDSKCCCQQQTVELTGLMRAVTLGHQQQHDEQQAQQSPFYTEQNGSGSSNSSQDDYRQQQQQQQQQEQLPIGAAPCICSCHSSEGYESISNGGVGTGNGDSAEQQGKRGSRLRYSQLSSEDSGRGGSGGLDLIENESFGKLSSGEILMHMRGLQSTYGEN